MPILASLLSSLIGGKPEGKPPAAQSPQLPETPAVPSVLQKAAGLPAVVEKPAVGQAASTPNQQQLPQEQLGPVEPHSFTSPRSLKQLGLFVAGASFLVLSTTITRRAIVRRTVLPKFYHPSHHGAMKQGNPDGPFIAAEALGLATLNVFSFGIMLTGGLAWAWDVSTLEDLRTRARKKLYGEAGVLDEDAEKEVEAWMAKVLAGVNKEEDAQKKEGEKKAD